MKTSLHWILLASLTLLVATSPGYGAGEKKDYPPTAAQDALEAACKQAAADSKMVFVKSGFPECGWCQVFDRYHGASAVQQILGKYYVVVAIDTKYMPDGQVVFSKLAQPGAPSWVIIAPDKKVIADSFAPTGNVGYPLQPNETEHYIAALKKATPKIADEELKTLAQEIKKAAGK